MYVCLCKGITESQLRDAVKDGASCLRDVRGSLGVASQCGKCGSLAREILREKTAGGDRERLLAAGA